MAGSVLSASDKLMTAASTGNTELVLQLLANSSSTLEPDEVIRAVRHLQGGPKMAHILYVSTLPDINRFSKLISLSGSGENLQ